MEEIYTRPFLTKVIRICSKCGNVDIQTYAKYKLQGKNYILNSMYSKCQSCGEIKEFTKEEFKEELRGR